MVPGCWLTCVDRNCSKRASFSSSAMDGACRTSLARFRCGQRSRLALFSSQRKYVCAPKTPTSRSSNPPPADSIFERFSRTHATALLKAEMNSSGPFRSLRVYLIFSATGSPCLSFAFHQFPGVFLHPCRVPIREACPADDPDRGLPRGG